MTSTRLVRVWTTLCENAGYGGYAGGGIYQQAESVLDVLRSLIEDGEDEQVTVTFIAGWLASSLASHYDVFAAAQDFFDNMDEDDEDDEDEDDEDDLDD